MSAEGRSKGGCGGKESKEGTPGFISLSVFLVPWPRVLPQCHSCFVTSLRLLNFMNLGNGVVMFT